MLSVLQESFASQNLLPTLLLILCVLYWLFVILGVLDLDLFDLDLTSNTDADLNLNPEGAESITPGWLTSIARFLNMAEVPAMIILSLASLFTWFIVVNLNAYLNPQSVALLGLAFFVPSLLAGLYLAKLLTSPLKPWFKQINAGSDHVNLIGLEAQVITSEINQQFGMVEVSKEGTPLRLQARITTAESPILKGSLVLIYQEDKKTGIVTVRKLTNSSIESI